MLKLLTLAALTLIAADKPKPTISDLERAKLSRIAAQIETAERDAALLRYRHRDLVAEQKAEWDAMCRRAGFAECKLETDGTIIDAAKKEEAKK